MNGAINKPVRAAEDSNDNRDRKATHRKCLYVVNDIQSNN